MTAPEQQAAPEPDLRQRIAQAARTVRLRLGPNAIGMAQRGESIPLSGGEADDLATAVLAVVQPELAALREQAERYQLGALERAALLEEARDALEAAGVNGAHGDDWPAIAPAIQALAADRDRHAASLAAALPSTDYHLRSNAEANHTIAASLRAKADAVLALHRPVPRGAMTICDACSPRRGDGPTRYVLVDYPCPTATALNAASLPTKCGPACGEQHTYDGCCQLGPTPTEDCPLPSATCIRRQCTQAASLPST